MSRMFLFFPRGGRFLSCYPNVLFWWFPVSICGSWCLLVQWCLWWFLVFLGLFHFWWFPVFINSVSGWFPVSTGSMSLVVPGFCWLYFLMVHGVYWLNSFSDSQCLLVPYLMFPVTVVLHFLDGSRCLLVPFLVGSHCLLYALHALYGSWCLLAKANGFFKLVFIFKFQILVVPSVCWVHVHCLWCFLCWQIQQIICCV